jgi:hypothetical protein
LLFLRRGVGFGERPDIIPSPDFVVDFSSKSKALKSLDGDLEVDLNGILDWDPVPLGIFRRLELTGLNGLRFPEVGVPSLNGFRGFNELNGLALLISNLVA